MSAGNDVAPGSEPDDASVSALTPETLELYVGFLEWILAVRLSDDVTDIAARELEESWKRRDIAAIEATLDFARTFEEVKRLDRGTQVYWREEHQPRFVAAIRAQGDELSQRLVALYDGVNAPLALGEPPLTQEIVDAYVQSATIAASTDPTPPSIDMQTLWIQELMFNWGALPQETRDAIADLPRQAAESGVHPDQQSDAAQATGPTPGPWIPADGVPGEATAPVTGPWIPADGVPGVNPEEHLEFLRGQRDELRRLAGQEPLRASHQGLVNQQQSTAVIASVAQTVTRRAVATQAAESAHGVTDTAQQAAAGAHAAEPEERETAPWSPELAPGMAPIQRVRPPDDIFPAPSEPVGDKLEGPYDDLKAGGYRFTVLGENHLSVQVPDAPRRIGGHYAVGELPPAKWFALQERHGYRLPIALQREPTSSLVLHFRVDPEPLRDLPLMAPMPGY